MKDQTPLFWIRLIHRADLIFGPGLLALLAFVFMSRKRFRKSLENAYLGENSALFALVMGDSNTAAIADMAAFFWRARTRRRISIDIWLGRVISKLNIADRPTRSKRPLPLEAVRKSPYKELFRSAQMVIKAKPRISPEIPLRRQNSLDTRRDDWCSRGEHSRAHFLRGNLDGIT